MQQAKDELDVKSGLQRRNPGIVPQRDIEKLEVLVDQRQSGIDAADAARESAAIRVSALLPAEKASAEARQADAQVDVDRTYVRAGVDGRVEQFLVRAGDVVNQMLRPAGILIPEGGGRSSLQAGFRADRGPGDETRHGRGSDLHLKTLEDHSAGRHKRAGFHRLAQFRTGDVLIDPQDLRKPGSILAFLEPLYKGGLEGVTPGSSCIVNAYTSNYDAIADPKTGTLKGFVLHAVDATGLVHALLLRIQALLLPTKTLVLSGH